MLTKKFFKTKQEAEVTFDFNRDDVTSVVLYAEFNQWQPVPMKFNKSAKAFRTKVRLPKGEQYAFRYLLNDQEWENDYKADAYQANEFGSEDSVVSTYQQ